jgi:menaquinol-cytochrome c reductase iron-sulfur subunit
MTCPQCDTPGNADNGTRKLDRRKLLTCLAVLANGAAGVVLGVPLLGYLLKPWIGSKQDQWVELGPIDSFSEDETRFVHVDNPVVEAWSGESAKVAMYIRREPADAFIAFAVNCTHLECPVAWFPESGLFLCPCHGGVYKADGTNVAGPPPRPLFRYPCRVENGKLFVLVGHLPTLADAPHNHA